jgi:hypothetical protein
MASSIATDTIIFGLEHFTRLYHRTRIDLVKSDLPKETLFLLHTKLDVLSEILNVRRSLIEFSQGCRDVDRVLSVLDFQIKKYRLETIYNMTPIERKSLYNNFLQSLINIKSDVETNIQPF